jgi:hypothetical protein
MLAVITLTGIIYPEASIFHHGAVFAILAIVHISPSTEVASA